jgi:hypothetical protein
MAIDNISQDLADFLVTKNFDPKYTDENGQDSAPNEAKVFSFDWTASSGKNYGTAVIVLGDDNDLGLFFGDNLGKSMEDPSDKNEWFQFLEEMSNFSTQHRYTFSPKDINQLKHTMTGMAAIKEGLFEGYYGTRKVSYVGEQTEARLVIKHNRMIGENDKRYRYVESLFIETAEGERFKLPFTKLTAGRAMLEHVKQGGKPYDIRGSHICEVVNEMSVLARFNRASQQRVFEGVTKELVESAQHYYLQLKESLQHMSTRRGYSEYFESWTPADIGDEDTLVEDIKQMFIEQTLDARIEAALPTLARIQQRGSAMKEAQIFENWINNLAEGTWALPETPEQQAKLDELMADELIVGPDATNATEQLYDLVGDDVLFDILQDLAERSNGRANVWDDTDVQQRLSELGIQLPSSGEEQSEEEPEQMNEGVLNDATGSTLDHLLDRFRYEIRQFQQTGQLDNDLYDALFDYYSHSGEMPYGVAKARTGDPMNWISDRLGKELGVDESNSGMVMPEADKMDAFAEMGTTGPAGMGGMAALPECNMTGEGHFCPQHGLAECGGTVAGGMAPTVMPLEGKDDPMNRNDAITGSYYESKESDALLARIKSLALLR